MRIDHGGHIAVAEKLLHRADIGARLKQLRGKAVTQGMHRNGLANARVGYSLLDRSLQPLFKQVMAALSACVRVDGESG